VVARLAGVRCMPRLGNARRLTVRRRPKQIRKRISRACRACKGQGQFLIAGTVVPCRKCKGTGYVRNK